MKKKANMTEYKFEGSGASVWMRSISTQAIMLKLQKKNPPPGPPIQEITQPNGETIREKNWTHPSYRQATAAYNEWLAVEGMEIALRNKVHIHLTEADKEIVAKIREETPELAELYETDEEIWLYGYAIASNEDYDRFIDEVGGFRGSDGNGDSTDDKSS